MEDKKTSKRKKKLKQREPTHRQLQPPGIRLYSPKSRFVLHHAKKYIPPFSLLLLLIFCFCSEFFLPRNNLFLFSLAKNARKVENM